MSVGSIKGHFPPERPSRAFLSSPDLVGAYDVSRVEAPAGGARAARDASPSLDSRTLNDRLPHYRVTLMDFGDGVVEASAVFVESRRRPKSPPIEDVVAELPDSPSSEDAVPELRDEYRKRERTLRSVRRARQSMKRRVYALCPDRLLTLTKRGKFATIDDAWSAWGKFERICSRFFGARWQYVVVPERHADGTYHLHVALKGFFHVGLLRRFWFRALGGKGDERGEETPGNVDMSFNRTGRTSRVRVARYLRKYMGKDLAACVPGRRSFAASRGLVPARVTRWREPIHLGCTEVDVLTRRIRALVGDIALTVFEWVEVGIRGFTIKTEGT